VCVRVVERCMKIRCAI